MGRLAPAVEQELAHKGWYRHPSAGIILQQGTEITAEQARAIDLQVTKGQQQAMLFPVTSRGSYNPQTQTYISPTGEKQSMTIEEARAKGALTQLPPTQAQIQQMPSVARTRLEVKPIIVNGQVTGFQDTRLQQSYSLQNIPQQRVADLERAGFIRTQQQEQIQKIQPQTVQLPPSQKLAVPTGMLIKTDESLKARGLAGEYKDGTIYLAPGVSESTKQHELGHYYTSAYLKDINASEETKLSKEGRFALGVKYADIFGGVEGYAPSEYSKEGLAIGYSWLKSGNILKSTAIRLTMPETTKFIEAELKKNETATNQSIANVMKEVQPLTLEVTKQDILGKVQTWINIEQTKEQRGQPPIYAPLLGVAASALGTAQLAKSLFIQPKETAVSMAKGFYSLGESFVTGKGVPEISRMIIEEPGSFGGYIAAEYYTAKGIGKVGEVGYDVGKAAITKLSPSYKAVEVSGLGEKTIKGVTSIAEEGKTFDIGLIPERGARLDIQPEKFVEEYKASIPLKATPIIPEVSSEYSKILGVVKKEGDIVTGSFAQKVLLEQKYTRPYKDIDILAKEQAITKQAVQSQLPSIFFERAKISEQGFVRGKQVIDIVPRELGEAGFLKKYGTINVQGIEFVSPEARLASKVYQYKIGKAKYEPKILKDIELLTGGKARINLGKATISGPYGFTAKELASYIGKTGPVTTSARGLFGWFKKEVPIKISEEGYGLFATPFDLETKQAMTRITRLGIEEKQAGIKDLLYGDITFGRTKPQIVVFEKQLIGKDFKVPFKSSELEVEAKGVIRQKGKGGVTLITPKGAIIPKRVPILIGEFKRAEEVLSKKTLGLIKKQSQKALSSSEILELQKRLSKETGISYREPSSYVSPVRLTSSFKSALSSEPVNTKQLTKSYSLVTKPSKVSGISTISAVYRPSGISKISEQIYKEPSVAKQAYKESYREPKYFKTSIYRGSEYREPRRPYVPPPTYPKYYPPAKPFKLIPAPKLTASESKRKSMKHLLGFDVYKILRGKPVPVARGVTREAGLDIGTREVLSNLRATFFLKKSNLLARDISTAGEFRRYRAAFREPVQKSKYRKYGEVYIQKATKVPGLTTGRLTFKGEKAEIKQAQLNKLIRSIK